MATSELSGVNFTAERNTINFFGFKGVILDRGSWAINGFLGDLLVEVQPTTMLPEIRFAFSDDETAGKADQIAMVIVGPRQAVIMWLEGLITREDLKNVSEGADFIDIPNVDIDGRNVIVRILQNPTYDVASADIEGNIL